MGRARGSGAKLAGAFELTPGTTPANGFISLPFVSHTLGEERPLIASDLLGQGREPQDPTLDVATDVGDVVVPVDVRNFGYWLKLFFGAPVSATGSGGEEVHTFTSGAASLPSLSLEVGSPEVPSYSTHYGARGDKLKISMTRSGLLNATASLIAVGESAEAGASVAGVPTSNAVLRFGQATGAITKDGVALATVVSADFTYMNSLEAVEVIKADGRIADSDPGMTGLTGTITVKFDSLLLLNAATSGTPIAVTFGWTNGVHSLLFTVPRVFLPRPKKPISGPNGIQLDFAFQASGAGGHVCTAVLTNDVPSYA